MEIASGLQVMEEEEEELRILSFRILRSRSVFNDFSTACLPLYLRQFTSFLFSRDATRGRSVMD